MRRIATMLLAGAAVLAGCGTNHRSTPGSITFYWNFRNSPGEVAGNFTQANTGCDVAGVDTIRVIIDGSATDQPCVQPSNGVPGATLFDFQRGQYDYRLEGYASGERVFVASGVTSADWNVDTPVDVTLDAVSPQSFVVYYDVRGEVPTQCVVDGVPVAGAVFELQDARGNLVDTTLGGDGVQRPVPCNQSFGVAFAPLTLGTYYLRYFALVDRTGASLVQACGLPVSHDGFPIAIDLVTATQTCP